MFYSQYPTKDNINARKSSCKGYFDNLQQYVAVGFQVENDSDANTITREIDNGGIFDFNDKEKKKINSLNMRGCHTLTMKQVDMIAYLFELAYDVMICQFDNVSNNPGLESVLGIF